MRIITLSWKEFSEEAFKEFKEALKEHKLYLGDLLEDYYGSNESDSYMLYINKRKLKKNEIKEIVPWELDLDDEL